MRGGRFLAGVVLGVGCATAPVLRKPVLDAAGLVREAEAELDRGCYLCLKSAAAKYENAILSGGRSLDIPAAGAWALVAVRERELGLRPSDALERVRSHRAPRSTSMRSPSKKGPPTAPADDPRDVIDAYVRAISVIGPLREGATKEAVAAAQVERRLMEPISESATVSLLRRRAEAGDRAASYLTRSLDCAPVSRPAPSSPGAGAEPMNRDEPASGLTSFLSANCRDRADPARDAATFAGLSRSEPRFHEAHYFLARFILADRKLVSAEREFLAAADGIPSMTAAWSMLGSTRVLMDEYEWAAADFGRAVDIEPDQREALLGQARALNYAGRFEEAIAPAQRLLDLGNWYVSDANYWLAFSELQLGRLQDADTHVREAKRTNPMNGDTARLVGLVAHRLAQLDRAQGEFELAVSRNRADCESHLHLGLIHGEKARYDASVTAFVTARDCFAAIAESAASKRGEIEASSLSESRKQTALGRLARKVQGYRSAQAGASLGAAESETQRADYDRALAYLAEAASEGPLTARVNELRTRIGALRARR
jgi:tetratricopeptide (TPR) repeat protein